MLPANYKSDYTCQSQPSNPSGWEPVSYRSIQDYYINGNGLCYIGYSFLVGEMVMSRKVMINASLSRNNCNCCSAGERWAGPHTGGPRLVACCISHCLSPHVSLQADGVSFLSSFVLTTLHRQLRTPSTRLIKLLSCLQDIISSVGGLHEKLRRLISSKNTLGPMTVTSDLELQDW